MIVDEQIQSYMLSFELTKQNHSNLGFVGNVTMKLIINILCQLRLDPWSGVKFFFINAWTNIEQKCQGYTQKKIQSTY